MNPDVVHYLGAVDIIKQKVTVNGCPGEIFISPSKTETNSIVWSDSSLPLIFDFTAEYDAGTLLKVAENIVLIEE